MTPRPDLFAVVSRHRWPLCPSALLRAYLLCAGSPLGQRIRTQLADDLEIAVFNHLIARDAAPFGASASPFVRAMALDARLVAFLEDA